MNTQTANPSLQAETPSAAVRELLRKAASMCILARIPEDAVVQVLREAYSDAPPRADVPSTYGVGSPVDAFSAGQVLSVWHQDSRFLDSRGHPRRLSVSNREFENLCVATSAALSPHRLLELLSQADAVSIDGDWVTARRRELIMDYPHPAAVARAARLSGAFMATLHHNLSRINGEPGNFERTVVSTKLSQKQLPSLLAYLSLYGQSFLEDLDAWMSARESTSPGPAIGVGIYLFVSGTNH